MCNNVLLVKIEGPIWYTIYHNLPVVKGVSSNPSINQPTNGKRTSMICVCVRIGSIYLLLPASGSQSRRRMRRSSVFALFFCGNPRPKTMERDGKIMGRSWEIPYRSYKWRFSSGNDVIIVILFVPLPRLIGYTG